jgi:hypothetical protein
MTGCGIERTKIFWKDTDRADFLSRRGELCQEGSPAAYRRNVPFSTIGIASSTPFTPYLKIDGEKHVAIRLPSTRGLP